MPTIFDANPNFGAARWDLAGNLLKYLLTNLQTGAIPESDWQAGDTDWKNKGVLRKFQQYEFLNTFVW